MWSFPAENNTSHDSRCTHSNPPLVDSAIKFGARSRWATDHEFQSKTQSCRRSRRRRSRERPGNQSNEESLDVQTSRSRNDNSFYEWKCCHCGQGPWGCGTSSCWACCSHERCADCPRKVFDNILTSERPSEGTYQAFQPHMLLHRADREYISAALQHVDAWLCIQYGRNAATRYNNKCDDCETKLGKSKAIVGEPSPSLDQVGSSSLTILAIHTPSATIRSQTR
jgi:hypothetical protein